MQNDLFPKSLQTHPWQTQDFKWCRWLFAEGLRFSDILIKSTKYPDRDHWKGNQNLKEWKLTKSDKNYCLSRDAAVHESWGVTPEPNIIQSRSHWKASRISPFVCQINHQIAQVCNCLYQKIVRWPKHVRQWIMTDTRKKRKRTSLVKISFPK